MSSVIELYIWYQRNKKVLGNISSFSATNILCPLYQTGFVQRIKNIPRRHNLGLHYKVVAGHYKNSRAQALTLGHKLKK